MDGKKTVDGSYNFEVNKHKPDPNRHGKITFDDILYVWFPNKRLVLNAIESLTKQLNEDGGHEMCLHFAGELSFEKDDI